MSASGETASRSCWNRECAGDGLSQCNGSQSLSDSLWALERTFRRDNVCRPEHHSLPLSQVYVYNFADLAILHQIDTLSNKLGLCAVSCEPKPLVLACPGIHKGQARTPSVPRSSRPVGMPR